MFSLVRELDEKYERIARELRRIEKDLAYVMRTVGAKRGLSLNAEEETV